MFRRSARLSIADGAAETLATPSPTVASSSSSSPRTKGRGGQVCITADRTPTSPTVEAPADQPQGPVSDAIPPRQQATHESNSHPESSVGHSEAEKSDLVTLPGPSTSSNFTAILNDPKTEFQCESKGDLKLNLKIKRAKKEVKEEPYFKTPVGLPPKRIRTPSARILECIELKEELAAIRVKSKASPKSQATMRKQQIAPKPPSLLATTSVSAGPSVPSTLTAVPPRKPKTPPVQASTSTSSTQPNNRLLLKQAQHAGRLQRAVDAASAAASTTTGRNSEVNALKQIATIAQHYIEPYRPVPKGRPVVQVVQQQTLPPPPPRTHPIINLNQQAPQQLVRRPQQSLLKPQPVSRVSKSTATKPPSQTSSQPAADQLPTLSDLSARGQLPNRDIAEVLRRKSSMSIKNHFIAWVNGELKNFLPPEAIPPLYTLPTHVTMWTVDHVHTFLHCVGYPKTAEYCRRHSVDGLALLLFRADDLTQVIGLQEFPALRLFAILNRLHMNLFAVIMPDPPPQRGQKRAHRSAPLGQAPV